MMEKIIRFDSIDVSTHKTQIIVITIDRTSWTIDLSPKNHYRLDKALKPFTDYARRDKLSANRGVTCYTVIRNKAVRDWAKIRDKIPAALVAEYDAHLTGQSSPIVPQSSDDDQATPEP